MLSKEEEAELARSNKKVKDWHHAGFKERTSDQSSENSPPTDNLDQSNVKKTFFKDKLVEAIPGAYVKAFDFTDLMDDDLLSDDEDVEAHNLHRQGMVAVKLSKETKSRIKKPWSKTIIVKPVGRSVSFSYMPNKLVQLWRSVGRMDCVDLSHEFFLVRFFSKEDLDSVLEKGLWFIGDFFLSLRLWEPFFKPAMANVSLVAVWVRLNALPIELYVTEVLKQIGESLGEVLRIDAHTAMEAQGKYVWLCIQIDINKPLINTILIGRFEQPLTYEGVHRLCFSCGRIGHMVEASPYTAWRDKDGKL